MAYKKIYIKLIRNAQGRKNTEDYYERHHVFPKSIFGDNLIIVNLTAKEHFIAHLLLWKYYQKKYGNTHKNTIKMMYAINIMRNTRKYINKKINSRMYDTIRKSCAIETSVRCSGMNHPLYGMTGEKSHWFNKKHTEQTLQKMSQSQSGINHPLYGKTHSEQTKLKMSKSHKNKFLGENNSAAKLTKQQVDEIRRISKETKTSQAKLSILFGVSKGCIQSILEYKTWRG